MVSGIPQRDRMGTSRPSRLRANNQTVRQAAYWPGVLPPAQDKGYDQGRNTGPPEPEANLHQPHRAQERLVPAVVQAVYAVNLRLQQEAGEPAGGVCATLRLLQLLPDSR